MFVYFNTSLYDQKKFGSLVWEPMHYIKYSANGNIKVIMTDALIPGVLKSRMTRLLLTRKGDKFKFVTVPPLPGRKLEPFLEDPEHVLREFQEIWRTLAFSRATTESGSSISSTDMLKWQLGRMGGFAILSRKFESEMAQNVGLMMSNSGFKSLLETVLGISGETDLRVLDGRIVYYPLAVNFGEKCLVRDAVNRFRLDAIYTRCITADSKVKRIFEEGLSSSASSA